MAPALVFRGAVRWRSVLLVALLGTVAGTALCLFDLARTSDQYGGLLRVGPDHPTVALVQQELPDAVGSSAGEHDGAQFYAIARFLPDLRAAAPYLDRPRYRLQRPLFPVLVRVLHPAASGGEGLEWAMFAVGVLAMALGAAATSVLATSLGASAIVGIAFPLLPGAFVSLRISVPDTLAAALLVVALALALRGRVGWAVLVGVAAVLTKEAMLIGLIGLAVYRRDRPGVVLAAVPAAVAAAWAAFLALLLPGGPPNVVEFTAPFVGTWQSVQHWASGGSPLAMLSVLAAVAVGVVALVRRGLGHPLAWALLLELAFLAVLSADVVGLERNGTRTTLVPLVLGIVLLATPAWRSAVTPPPVGATTT